MAHLLIIRLVHILASVRVNILDILFRHFIGKVETILSRAIDNLSSRGVALERETWIKHAEDSEKSGYLVTCRSIIEVRLLLP